MRANGTNLLEVDGVESLKRLGVETSQLHFELLKHYICVS